MGTNTIPLFLAAHIDWQANLLDKWTFKKGFGDKVDNLMYRLILNAINNNVSDDIPDEFKPEFHQAMDLVVAGDYDDAGAEAIDTLVQLINKTGLKQAVKDVVLGVLKILKGVIADLD
jgi:hypothetical protein